MADDSLNQFFVQGSFGPRFLWPRFLWTKVPLAKVPLDQGSFELRFLWTKVPLDQGSFGQGSFGSRFLCQGSFGPGSFGSGSFSQGSSHPKSCVWVNTYVVKYPFIPTKMHYLHLTIFQTKIHLCYCLLICLPKRFVPCGVCALRS